jgi:hypothetical protein
MVGSWPGLERVALCSLALSFLLFVDCLRFVASTFLVNADKGCLLHSCGLLWLLQY